MTDDDPNGGESSLDPTRSMGPLPEHAAESSDSSGSGRVRQLDPGDVLGDRFTIVRFLARGGMGEVYEAADRHLQNKHCALKILRSEIASDPNVRQRFEREVLLAREVTHPNVCPTFDLFRMEGPRGPVMFLTMKLLRGESLSTRLKRAGPFEIESAWPIVRQMADALDAAHRAGVIHRDFKPGNVMLEQSSGEIRVSITDFGLSRAYEADESRAETGRISGTIGYIAPELMQGGTATPASDVYAFGVVVHEMLTGRRPSSQAGQNRFLPPSRFVEGLPRAWDRLVMGCLQTDLAKRFQSAGEAISMMEARGSTSRSARLRTPAPRARRWIIGGAAAVLLVAAAWLSLPGLETILHPLPAKRFVALMAYPMEPNSEYRPLLKSVLDTAAGRLARAEASVKDLMVISPGDVAGQAAPKGPAEAVGTLGANLVLAASVRSSPGGVVLSLRVLDAATQKVLREKEVAAAESELSRLPEMAASAAGRILDIPAARARAQDGDGLASVPVGAYQHYATAEELMSQPNDAGLEQATEHYLRAVEIDPRFALAYARLSTAYIRKYHQSKDPALLNLAARNAELALKYNPDSSKALLSRAQVDVDSGRTQQALDELGQALKLDPGNPQILLVKARTLRDLDRRVEEEDLYRGILKDRPNYWPAYLELGQVLYRHGSYAQAAEAFAEGSAVAPRVALLVNNLGVMYLLLGRKEEAEQTLLKALQLGPNESAYSNLGSLAFTAGDYRRALDYYTKARDLRPARDVTWRNIGDCYMMLGDRARMIESYRKAEALLEEALKINPKPGASWMNLAFYRAKLGRRDEAAQAMQTAESRGAGDLQSQFKKAQVLALMGRKEESVQQVLKCMENGLSRTEVELAPDLKEVRSDPRYKRQAAQMEAKK